jgi:CRP/FNR family transcriptional regulator, cyclic AMP receptor protein
MPATSPGALDTMRILAKNRPLRRFKAGEEIFRSGEKGDCLYGVVEGSVKLSWDSDGLDGMFETIEAGSSFGVGALVDPEHRRYGTATALTDTQLLVMNREEFLFALQELPMFGLEMLHSLDERLRGLKARQA